MHVCVTAFELSVICPQSNAKNVCTFDVNLLIAQMNSMSNDAKNVQISNSYFFLKGQVYRRVKAGV